MGFLEDAKKLKEKEAENDIQNKTNVELIDSLEQIQTGNMIDKKQKADELTQELYRRAVENIKISEWEKIKINKNNFEDKDQVIDILLYTVGKMSMDNNFYKLNIGKLKNYIPIYTKEAE